MKIPNSGKRTPRFVVAALAGLLLAPQLCPAETRDIAGWQVHLNPLLLGTNAAVTERALTLLKKQLEEIIRVVPKPAVAELQKVPLWISPEYRGVSPRAEFHPAAGWLRKNGRDPAMAKGVEFTNVRTFDQDIRRMPVLALHELAHAFHDRVITNGFANADIKATYTKAKEAGTYDRVERKNSEGRTSMDRAYALTNPMEYFAETTEAFFGQNDFFPYTRDELKQHDPSMFALLEILWGTKITAHVP